LQDIVPTLLYLLKLPIPTYMDGDVITSALHAQTLIARPIERSDNIAGVEIGGEAASAEDEQRIRSRLAALGYLD
jgi:hypothetical protein